MLHSGVGSCLRWSGACLSATTVPEVTTGRAASQSALGSCGPSWRTVTSFKKATVTYQAALSHWFVKLTLQFMFCFVIRVLDTTGHVGSERAALPPTVAVRVSLWVPPAFLDSGPGDPAAGWRPPAGSVRRGAVQNHL